MLVDSFHANLFYVSARKSFYVYIAAMALINATATLGSAILLFWDLAGLWYAVVVCCYVLMSFQ